MRMEVALTCVTILLVVMGAPVVMDMNWTLTNIIAMVMSTSCVLYSEIEVTMIADIDECARGTATCDANASCNNTIGGYNCTCNSGYEGNGFHGNCSSESMNDN